MGSRWTSLCRSLFRQISNVLVLPLFHLLFGASSSSASQVSEGSRLKFPALSMLCSQSYLCGTCVMGPELSRITSASVSMSLTSYSSFGFYASDGILKDTPCRLLEWTTSGVDFTGFRWPDQGLVSLASPVPLSESSSGWSAGPQTILRLNPPMIFVV